MFAEDVPFERYQASCFKYPQRKRKAKQNILKRPKWQQEVNSMEIKRWSWILLPAIRRWDWNTTEPQAIQRPDHWTRPPVCLAFWLTFCFIRLCQKQVLTVVFHKAALTWIKLLSPLSANNMKGPSMESFSSNSVFFLLPQQSRSLDICKGRHVDYITVCFTCKAVSTAQYHQWPGLQLTD